MAHDLKLTYIRDCAEDAIRQARHLKQDYATFLEALLNQETERRAGNGITRRIKEAKFPIKKYLVDFDKNKYDPQFTPKFEELETLEFINNKENIILIGTPGAGKTHYAIALGISACMQGKSVLFASLPNLVVELREALNHQQLSVLRRRPVLTGAMIDRLAHKAHVLDITREHGGRFEETIAWLTNKAETSSAISAATDGNADGNN